MHDIVKQDLPVDHENEKNEKKRNINIILYCIVLTIDCYIYNIFYHSATCIWSVPQNILHIMYKLFLGYMTQYIYLMF